MRQLLVPERRAGDHGGAADGSQAGEVPDDLITMPAAAVRFAGVSQR
jgi:hypothetical protein